MIEHGTWWMGKIEDRYGPFKVHLARRKADWTGKGAWILTGDMGTCGQIQGWAQGCRCFTPAYYTFRGEPVPPVVVEFDVRVLERHELVQGPEKGVMSWDIVHTPVKVPLVARFKGVRFTSAGCAGIDSLCSGKVEFDCESFEEVLQEEPCDEPLLVKSC